MPNIPSVELIVAEMTSCRVASTNACNALIRITICINIRCNKQVHCPSVFLFLDRIIGHETVLKLN